MRHSIANARFSISAPTFPFLNNDDDGTSTINVDKVLERLDSCEMERWSLRFKDAATERHYAHKLKYGNVRVDAFFFCVFIYLLVVFFVSPTSIFTLAFANSATPASLVYHVCWIGLFVMHLLAISWSRLVVWGFVNERWIPCELCIIYEVGIACLAFPFANQWRVVSLVGSDRDASFPSVDGEVGYIDDSVTLSLSLAALTFIVLALPVRFHLSVLLLSFFTLSAVWSTAVAGAPDDNVIYNAIVLTASMVLYVVIKWDLDGYRRCSYVSETKKRRATSAVEDAMSFSANTGIAHLSKLGSVREKLTTLAYLIASEESAHLTVGVELVSEIFELVKYPHTLLNEAKVEVEVEPARKESHFAIQQFLSENFVKPSDMVEEDMDTKSACDSIVPGDDLDGGKTHDVTGFCHDWFFDITARYRQLGNRTLTTLVPQEIRKYCKDCDSEVNAFVAGLSAEYKTCAYHHEGHAAQVVNHAGYLARVLRVSHASTSLEKLAFVVATAAHDVGHFGRNNKFCIATRHAVALTYNDRSVLENMHASTTFRLLENPLMFFLKKHSDSDFCTFRSIVIDTIISTDMSLNADAMSAFRLRADCEDFSLLREVDRRSCYRIIIKAADIGHGSLNWEEHCVWSYWLCAEFFEQGDAERNLSLPISALCDRKNCDFSNSQQGFLRYCCLPLFECLTLVPDPEPEKVGQASAVRNDTKRLSVMPPSVHSRIGSRASVRPNEAPRAPRMSVLLDVSSKIQDPESIIAQIEENCSSWKDVDRATICGATGSVD